MPLRLVEMVLDHSLSDWTAEPIDGVTTQGMWTTHLGGDNLLVRILVKAEDAEQLLEILQHRYGSLEEFRCVLLPVEATLPPPDPEAKPDPDSSGAAKVQAPRRSREELHEDVQEQARLTAVFVVMAGLSAVVAGIGLVRDDVAVIIGAMVIAPLLGPNMALSLATCLGERRLFGQALKALVVGGVVVAFWPGCWA